MDTTINELLTKINTHIFLQNGIKLNFKELTCINGLKYFLINRLSKDGTMRIYRTTSIRTLKQFLNNFLKSLDYFPEYIDEKNKETNEKKEKLCL